jgi:hypothetical protein
MSHVDEKRQPEVILAWYLEANARFQLPLAPVFGVPGGWSPIGTLHPFWGNFRVGGDSTATLEDSNFSLDGSTANRSGRHGR